MLPLLLAALLVLPAEPVEVEARLSSGAEADSNARREISGEAPRADLLWRTQGVLVLAREERGHRLSLESQLGAKLFSQEHSEDLGVLELHGRFEARVRRWLALFLDASGRDRRQRSGQRSYDTATADAGLVLGPFSGVQVVGGLGPRAFLFWPDPRFHNLGAGAYLAGLVRLTEGETLGATLGTEGRWFPLGAPATGTGEDGQRTFNFKDRRRDGTAFGEVSLESVRVLYVRAAYRLTGNVSNSQGEMYLRNRLALTAGTALPGGARVLVEGQLQATRWPQGLGLGERLALQEGDENQTNASALLGVPLVGRFWLEGRLAAYTAELSAVRAPFLRTTAWLGLAARW